MQKKEYREDNLLSPDELKAIRLWRSGVSQTEAYKKVMLTEMECRTLKPNAIYQRVKRFFGTDRMKNAMIATEGKRGQSVRKKIEQEELKKRTEIKDKMEISAFPHYENEQNSHNESEPNKQKEWINSLSISNDPSAMSIYGTGLFLIQVAVTQIIKRRKIIEENHIDAFDKMGCPYTKDDINAIKTAAAMILPFAPAPTTAERRAMAMAGVIVGLTQQEIDYEKFDPKDYEASKPDTVIDVNEIDHGNK